jgi:predicted AlkP superfamily phosphohydrolase/phosphomutase
MKNQKVVVIGLDCAPPKLVFELWKDKLPHISRIIDKSLWGPLRSSMPPITVPAWMCMVTGKDPGHLGLYGFRERVGNSYTKSQIVNSSYIKEKTIWDLLGKKGKKSIILGVPPTYPPKKMNGILIADFLTPSIQHVYTYPRIISQEIKHVVGDYLLDTKFRTEDRKNLLKEICLMTEKRFTLAKYLLQKKSWDFFMMVEIGVDRIQHAYWKYFDKNHRRYRAGNPFENALFDYYQLIDQKIGELLKIIPKDTIIFIVSDHGVKKMDGAFCINEWLIKEKYLILKTYPQKITSLEEVEVDWSKTRAWAWGGYYARVFLNLKGRDPKGTINKKDFHKEREILRRKLMNITDEKGKKLQNLIKPPEKFYKIVNGNPPDLFAIFGNLSWRAAGTIGHSTQWIFDNDTGPDDAVHDWDGILIKYDPENPKKQHKKNMNIYGILPMIRNEFDI